MKVFTVMKSGGIEDDEFAAYTQLLEDIRIDLSNAPRTLEPGTNRHWLHVWEREEQAERFARELQARTRDRTWDVHDFEIASPEVGPVAPLNLYTIRERAGASYYLDPASRGRILRLYPHAGLSGSRFFSDETQSALIRQHGTTWWGQVCKLLTGLTEAQIGQLGGYRFFEPGGRVAHEELPGTRAS